MGGRDYCSVVGCNNRRCEVKLPFHRIPKQPISRRKLWIKATGRQCHGKHKFIVSDYTKVCGAHFVNLRKSNDPNHVDYVPTVNLPHANTMQKSVRKSSTSTKARIYHEAVTLGVAKKSKLIDIDDVQQEVSISNIIDDENHDYILAKDQLEKDAYQIAEKFSDHDYAKTGCREELLSVTHSASIQTDVDELGCCLNAFTATKIVDKDTQTIQSPKSNDIGVQIDSFDNLTSIKQKSQGKVIRSLNERIVELTKECNSIKQKVFSSKTVLKTSDKVQFYTGLPDIGTYNALFFYLKPKAEKLSYWRGKRTKIPTKNRYQKLPIEEQFFMTLVRLRLGLNVEDLSDRFNISIGQVSSIFNTWVRFLRLELEALFPYPSSEQVQQNMPESFSRFPNTRLIIDCTEIFVQKPSALKAQRQTWSNYKHRNTHKILIGITPDGTVAYISPLFGGSASDKHIVKNSGLLQLIEPGDNIMADRGFNIESELNKLNAHLNIPPFLNGKHQLSPEQVEETRRIAEVRIHVERAIQRIKNFKILCGTMPANLMIAAEDIFKVCSYLTNFQPPILKI